MIIYMRQNDTSPSTEVIIERRNILTGAETIVDITGCTVHFKILDLQTGEFTNEGHSECTITSAEDGEARYDYVAGDLPSAGSYRVTVQTHYPSGRIETQPDEVMIQTLGEVS